MRAKVCSTLTAIAALMLLMCVPGAAQWHNYPTPGIPRTADGKPNLSAPAPRTADGKPDLSGIWRTTASRYTLNVAADLKAGEIQPWAAAASRHSLENFQKDEPGARCLPPGPKITFMALFKIVQTPTVLVLLHEAVNSIFRQILMDGRDLPKDANPTWLGYSVGHWKGDNLVVETAGFNDKTTLDAFSHPHTEALHITERFRRRDFGHLELQMRASLRKSTWLEGRLRHFAMPKGPQARGIVTASSFLMEARLEDRSSACRPSAENRNRSPLWISRATRIATCIRTFYRMATTSCFWHAPWLLKITRS
jgi:hypothetical protein